MSFPHFDGSISSVKDGRTKVRSILLLWSLKFYDKKYFSLGIEKQCLNKVSFENIVSAYMFSPDAVLPPSSETQGQSVGSGEKAARKFHQTISKDSSGCRLLIGHKKCFVLLCPISEHISWVTFVCLYTKAIISIMACLAHVPKKCRQSQNFQFDIKSPSDFKILSAWKLKTLFQKYKLELTTGIHACIGHVLRKY